MPQKNLNIRILHTMISGISPWNQNVRSMCSCDLFRPLRFGASDWQYWLFDLLLVSSKFWRYVWIGKNTPVL